MNPIRQKLQSGHAAIGCFLGLGSPNVAEMLGHAGFDWLVIETEHNALGPAEIEHMLMALGACPTVPMVRVPSSDKPLIQNALDIGARGIVVPMVRSVEEARAVVAATRYPPTGTRGFGPLRASHYNYRRAEYYATANEEILVALVIETLEAWENLEAIAQVPGLDVFFLGLSDLSLALGLDLMNPDSAEVAQIEKRLLDIGRRWNVALGCGIGSNAQIQTRIVQGFTFLGCADHGLLATATQALLENKESLPGRPALC